MVGKCFIYLKKKSLNASFLKREKESAVIRGKRGTIVFLVTTTAHSHTHTENVEKLCVGGSVDAVEMHVYRKGDGRPRPHLQYLSFLFLFLLVSVVILLLFLMKSCKLIRVLIVITIYQ